MPQKSSKPVVALGDLVSAAFESARVVSPDDHTAAQLATRTVARLLARSGRLDVVKRLRRS